MPEAVKTFSAWLIKWQPIVAAVIACVAVGIGWQTVRSEATAMDERITQLAKGTDERIVAVEKKLDRMDSDHDLLIRIDTRLQTMDERLRRIEAKP